VRGAGRCRRAVLLKTASKRVRLADRAPIVVDRSKSLLGLGVRAGAATQYIFAQGCGAGDDPKDIGFAIANPPQSVACADPHRSQLNALGHSLAGV
jgi:hypothetical protein